ncbi:phage tail protein I [Sphingomonas cavernae]|uniref:Phage tail protein I n=1 Tax=Sphingomonas cavernae TaxID=2320861 RepID=A0A418WP33_9SPHN|nr:phage tail protein I [Sphingomonas cavernae]RJF92985.1 phage tail protein I [Sphingomonas cavernae]
MSLLPPNATPLERALEAAVARVSGVPVPIRDLFSPDRCPVNLLPWLAWYLSLDSWSSDWPEGVKRERVRQAIPIQRRKGTARSVRDVVESFGGSVALREWWQLDEPGDPHTFELILTLNGQGGVPVSAAFVDAVIAEVHRTKPVRSHFTFTQGLQAEGSVGLIGVARPAVFVRLTANAPAA